MSKDDEKKYHYFVSYAHLNGYGNIEIGTDTDRITYNIVLFWQTIIQKRCNTSNPVVISWQPIAASK